MVQTKPTRENQTTKRARSESNSTAAFQPTEQKPRLDTDAAPHSPTASSSPKTIADSDYTAHAGKWGFVVYRTTYGDEDEWRRAKAKLVDLAVEQWKHKKGEGDGDFADAKLKFVEDKETLDGKGVVDVRMIHNPLYRPEKDDDDDDEAGEDEDEDEGEAADNVVAIDEYGGLDSTICLMIDEASMESILDNDGSEKLGYVIALDATTRKSEMEVEWDGTMRIHIEALMHDFFLCCVGNGAMIMGEMHDPDNPEDVWIGH